MPMRKRRSIVTYIGHEHWRSRPDRAFDGALTAQRSDAILDRAGRLSVLADAHDELAQLADEPVHRQTVLVVGRLDIFRFPVLRLLTVRQKADHATPVLDEHAAAHPRHHDALAP